MDTNQDSDLVDNKKTNWGDTIRKVKEYIQNHPLLIIIGFVFSIVSIIATIKLSFKGKGEIVDRVNNIQEAFCEEKTVSTKLLLNNLQLSEDASIKIWSIKINDTSENHINKCSENNGEVCFEVCENDKEIYISVTLLNKPAIIKNYSSIEEIPQNIYLDEK